MHPLWQQLLAEQKSVLEDIEQRVLTTKELTPSPESIMRAFEQDPMEIRVLVIGQDPYPTSGVACGLAFAIQPDSKTPQSLKNLMLELAQDIPGVIATGNLLRWRDQGVLLLNASLSTQVGVSGAHQKLWQGFTLAAIKALSQAHGGKLVTLALGRFASELAKQCELEHVVFAVHPSPLSASRGFFGSRVFSRVNSELKQLSLAAVDWSC